MELKCNECNVSYKSRSGLFKHNKIFHNHLIRNKFNKNTANNICSYCDKKLSNYTSKWRHEQKCKENKDIKIMEMQKHINNLQTQINKITNNTTNSNNTINNNTNNTNNSHNTNNNITNNQYIYVIPFSKEPNDILSNDVMKKIIAEKGINSVIELVKKKHFNPDLPECHNFCVTAKNDIFANIVDPETRKIKAVNKKDIFDTVYSGIVSNVNNIKTSNEEINDTITNINNIPLSKKMLKKLHIGINEEAYHNRDLIKTTWDNAKFEEFNSQSLSSKRESIILQFQNLIDEINKNKI
jgi:hypothetical protein